MQVAGWFRRRDWGSGVARFALGVDDLDGALLELDCIATSGDGDRDETFCKVDVAVVIDADLYGDDDNRVDRFRKKLLISDFYGALLHIPGFAPYRGGLKAKKCLRNCLHSYRNTRRASRRRNIELKMPVPYQGRLVSLGR